MTKKSNQEDVLEFISGLSVLELSKLIKEFETKFGVESKQELSKEVQSQSNKPKKGTFDKNFLRGKSK